MINWRNRWVVTFVALVIFLSIIFAGMGIFESTKPKPKTSGFYENGLYIEYTLQWRVVTPSGKHGGFGILTLNVIKNIINLNITIPNLYSNGSSLYRKVTFSVKNDDVYYLGKEVMLPFFHSNNTVISYYNGSYVNATGKITSLVNFQGGIIQFQPVYYLYNKDYVLYPNGTLREKGLSATYEYGSNTNLLFFYYCGVAYDPVIYYILNLTYPVKMENGTVWYMPMDIGLSLHKTSIDLGSVDYFAVVLALLWLGLPVILLILIPMVIIIIYKSAKNKKRVQKSE